MSLKTCTFTGIDDSVSFPELRAISEQYPFVEWGVLRSISTFGVPKYPSLTWIKKLVIAVPELKKSLHLCGQEAIDEFFDLRYKNPLYYEFDRIQINKSHLVDKFYPSTIKTAVSRKMPTEIIFQYNDHNEGLDEILRGVGNCSFLFDASRGSGISPEKWNTPFYKYKCGYAGGLGPDNIEEQLPLIEKASLGTDYWIDMETKIRTGDKLDLDKVRFVAEVVQKYIVQKEKGLLAQPFPEGDLSSLFVNLPPY